MKTGYWVVLILLVIVLVGGYLERHQIRTLLNGYSMTPTQSESMASSSPEMTASPLTQGTSEIVMTKSDPTKGGYLAGPDGMSLYTFDKDKPGVSNCTGSCATLWPPYTQAAATATMPANFATIKRSDGSMQYTYKVTPLYFYSPDKQPGDTTGDGVGGVWHLAKP